MIPEPIFEEASDNNFQCNCQCVFWISANGGLIAFHHRRHREVVESLGRAVPDEFRTPKAMGAPDPRAALFPSSVRASFRAHSHSNVARSQERPGQQSALLPQASPAVLLQQTLRVSVPYVLHPISTPFAVWQH